MNMILIGAGIACFIASVVCALAGTLQSIELRCELNDRLPEAQKFEPMFWHFGTYQKFRRLLDEVMPENPRRQKLRRLGAMQMTFFLISMGLFWTAFEGPSILAYMLIAALVAVMWQIFKVYP